jgi:hypothetical protein
MDSLIEQSRTILVSIRAILMRLNTLDALLVDVIKE